MRSKADDTQEQANKSAIFKRRNIDSAGQDQTTEYESAALSCAHLAIHLLV